MNECNMCNNLALREAVHIFEQSEALKVAVQTASRKLLRKNRNPATRAVVSIKLDRPKVVQPGNLVIINIAKKYTFYMFFLTLSAQVAVSHALEVVPMRRRHVPKGVEGGDMVPEVHGLGSAALVPTLPPECCGHPVSLERWTLLVGSHHAPLFLGFLSVWNEPGLSRIPRIPPSEHPLDRSARVSRSP